LTALRPERMRNILLRPSSDIVAGHTCVPD
jgi:hypothetical protein